MAVGAAVIGPDSPATPAGLGTPGSGRPLGRYDLKSLTCVSRCSMAQQVAVRATVACVAVAFINDAVPLFHTQVMATTTSLLGRRARRARRGREDQAEIGAPKRQWIREGRSSWVRLL